MLKTIGNKERLIVTTGAKENKVEPSSVAKALGAEYVGYAGVNPHNLSLPKPVQERLIQGNATSEDKEAEMVAQTR